ncbi:hypothetical protein HU200_056380 [Digitaria exilis]|uniref:Uncharacterized protein n=1 Tax=Digitaria exilis TaxID=1010633 RepID=A0A835E2F3_9POAL|nr:hypothetical protein HU200_056380 [Digitaria exilis]
MALMFVATAQARALPPSLSSQGSCPPGFKSYLDLTDYLEARGLQLITDVGLMPLVQHVIGIIPQATVSLCVCREG